VQLAQNLKNQLGGEMGGALLLGRNLRPELLKDRALFL